MRVAAAVLYAQQFDDAAVELVLADGADSQAHQVQRVDGRLVVEQRREQRRGADQVAGGDEYMVRIFFARKLSTSVAMCSAPPAGTAIFAPACAGSLMRIPPGGGRSLPWKSLIARSFTSTGTGEDGRWSVTAQAVSRAARAGKHRRCNLIGRSIARGQLIWGGPPEYPGRLVPRRLRIVVGEAQYRPMNRAPTGTGIARERADSISVCELLRTAEAHVRFAGSVACSAFHASVGERR